MNILPFRTLNTVLAILNTQAFMANDYEDWPEDTWISINNYYDLNICNLEDGDGFRYIAGIVYPVSDGKTKTGGIYWTVFIMHYGKGV